VTALQSVELTVYPYECDAYGHLNEAAFLQLFERARWEALAAGPGMDLFKRNNAWPAVRRVTVDYKAGVYPGDVLRIESVVTQRGTTSVTIRHIATRIADRRAVAEADIVFVMIDREGRPVPMTDELAKFFGPRASSGHTRETVRIEVAGAEISVDVRGEGLPVLFVHGFPLDRSMWRHQLAVLTKCRRIAPDLRGAGASSAPVDGYAMSRYADDLVAVLGALGLKQVVVCGLSMGGYVAFDLVRRHGDRVKALILANTRAEPDTAEGRKGRDELAALAVREGVEGVNERLLPKLLAPSAFTRQPELVTEVREMMGRYSVPGLVGALRALRDRPDSTATLKAIRVPTLVLAGEEDQLIALEVGERMAAAIPGARFVTIPDAGHLAPLEQPIPTSSALAEFLASLS
jgi:YbgC/YbaW family acyl-CoA thioester hydrolase